MKKDTCPLMFTDSSPAIFSGSNAEATRCNFKLHASTYVQQSVSGSAPSDAVADARQQWHVAVRVSDEDERRHKWESVYTSRHKWEWLGASCAVSLAMAELSEEAVERPAKRARVEESLRSLIARFKCSITRELLRNGSFYVSHNIGRRRFAIMMRVLVGPCCYCRRASLRTHGHRAVAH